MIHFDCLINFTGGLDSTYAVWDYLVKNPNKRLLIHHCELRNYQSRADKETVACNNIIEWLRSQGFKNFEYIKTKYDQGMFRSTINDIEIIGFMTAMILRSNAITIGEIAITASAQDLTQGPSYELRSKSRYEIIKLISRKENIKYTYPIINLSRWYMLQNLPKELKEMLWFCRKPINDKPCRICKTCRWTLPYLKS